jgi:hypothetical protein
MKDYNSARSAAQVKANATGFDYGLSRDYFGDWQIRMLPQRRNRQGHELSCEVVSCEVIDRCRPGHGPLA